MSTNENTPISGQFWDWMQSYWHSNRDFPPAHPDWRKKADLVDGKVPAGQLPSYVDDVLEFDSYPSLPQPGEKGKIYITTKDNKQFRWGGSAYIEINSGENVMTLNTEQSISGRKYFVTSNGSDILNQKLWLRSFDGSNPAAVYYKDGYGSGALGFDGDEFRLTNVGTSASAYLNTKGIKKDRSSDDYFLTGGGGHLDSRTKEDSWFHSSRDFSKGTLIETDVDYSVEYGDQFLLEMKGNMYFDRLPLDAKIQGYIYYGTIIAQSGYSTVNDFNYVIALNFNGKLCFWFPRMAYWQGFDVKLTVGYGGLNQGKNRVINVSDSDDPKGTKRVQINLEKLAFRSWVDKNYLPFTGGSLSGDLALKILKSDVLDGNQIVNAGNKNQLYFGNPTVDTVYHESGNNHIFSNKGNASFTIDTNGNVTAKNAVNAGNDSEIGGRIFGKRTVIDTLGLDESKYYPVTIQCNSSYPSTIKVYRTLDASMGVPSYSTHGGGFWCYYEFEVYGSGWGTSHFKAICNYQDESWVKNDIKVIGYDQMARSSNVVIYLRGGSKYWLDVNSTSVPSLHTSPFTVYDETVEPTKSRIWSGGILMNANASDIHNAVNGLASTLKDYVTLNTEQSITKRKIINKDLGTNDYINVAQHNAQFQIGKSSDAKSLEFAVLDNGTSIIQSKEVGVGYNSLVLNPSNSGGVSIGGLPATGHGLSVSSSIYSVNGYYKQGYDNNYLLLAGGGHKLLSDLGNTHYHKELFNNETNDNSNVHTLLEDYKFKFIHKLNPNAPNIFTTPNAANSILAIATHPGGYGALLGFNGNGDTFIKNVAAGTYSSTWAQFAYRSWVSSEINSTVQNYITLNSTQQINGKKTFETSFNTYTDDGLFDLQARPLSTLTPNGAKNILLGYKDYGSGQYYPRIGFKSDTSWSMGPIGDNFTIGLDNNGTSIVQITKAGNLSALNIVSQNIFGNGLTGNQMLSNGPDVVYLGNPSLQNLFIESANNDLFHNRTGYGLGKIWDAHNFNPNSKVNATDGAQALGFYSGNTSNLPFILTTNSEYITLGTVSWINDNFIRNTHSVYNISQSDINNWNNSVSTSSASEEVILEDNTLKIQPDELSLEGSGSYDIGSRKKLVHVLLREGKEVNIRELVRRQTIIVFNFSKDPVSLNIEGLKPYALSPGMQVTLYISDEREVLLYNETGFKKLQ